MNTENRKEFITFLSNINFTQQYMCVCVCVCAYLIHIYNATLQHWIHHTQNFLFHHIYKTTKKMNKISNCFTLKVILFA